MNSKQQVDDDPSARRRKSGIPAWKISLGGIAAATAVLVALGAGSASGDGAAASTRENVRSTSAASTRAGDGQLDVDSPKPGPTGFSDLAAAEALNPFDWAAHVACRLVEEIDPGSKRTAGGARCDRWPAQGIDVNDVNDAHDAHEGPGCERCERCERYEELIMAELREGDLEDVVAAALVFGLLADGLEDDEISQ